jgi:hypothetical protein
VDTKPTGLPIGSSCDPSVDIKNDPCSGFCIGDSDTDFKLCSGTCNLAVATACGWDGTGKADAACLFAPGFVDSPAAGDMGYCDQLCDCSADCRNPKLSCVALSASEAKVFKRAGYCTLPQAGSGTVISTCPQAGGGGSGGGGSVGAAGAGGSN